MKTLGSLLSHHRNSKNLILREVSALSEIDQALLSKFERGLRKPTVHQLARLAEVYDADFNNFKALWLAEKVVDILQYEQVAPEALALAESRIEYLTSSKSFAIASISSELKDRLDKMDILKARWKGSKPLNKIQLQKMREYFYTEYTYESNRIEGNTLTLQETSLVINEGLTIGGKSMTEHLEAVNHAEAIKFIENLVLSKEDLNRRTLMEIHRLILKGIDPENAGRLRSVQVRISGSKHLPAQPYLLNKLMEDYYMHYNSQKNILHPILLAAEMHERLVSIHPFIDGNGRTSRLVMNLILLKNGYTIANLKGDDQSRMNYYKALEGVQVENDPEPFYKLVIEAVERSLKEHLELV